MWGLAVSNQRSHTRISVWLEICVFPCGWRKRSSSAAGRKVGSVPQEGPGLGRRGERGWAARGCAVRRAVCMPPAGRPGGGQVLAWRDQRQPGCRPRTRLMAGRAVGHGGGGLPGTCCASSRPGHTPASGGQAEQARGARQGLGFPRR